MSKSAKVLLVEANGKEFVLIANWFNLNSSQLINIRNLPGMPDLALGEGLSFQFAYL
jgi:hypothetical protein